MPRPIAKAIREAVNNKIIGAFIGLGATFGHDDYWHVDTTAGDLRFSIHDDSIYAGIYTRFNEPERATKLLLSGASLNPYSGKWNWHFDWKDADTVLRHFCAEVRTILKDD